MKFELQPSDKAALEKLVKSGMTPIIISQRAQILLKKAENKSSAKIAEELNVNRHTVELWCQKYRNRTSEQTIMDILSVAEGRGRKEEITGEARTSMMAAPITVISYAIVSPPYLNFFLCNQYTIFCRNKKRKKSFVCRFLSLLLKILSSISNRHIQNIFLQFFCQQFFFQAPPPVIADR